MPARIRASEPEVLTKKVLRHKVGAVGHGMESVDTNRKIVHEMRRTEQLHVSLTAVQKSGTSLIVSSFCAHTQRVKDEYTKQPQQTW